MVKKTCLHLHVCNVCLENIDAFKNETRCDDSSDLFD